MIFPKIQIIYILEQVEITLEKCGHKTIKKCYEKKPKCTTKCTDRLQCGHACNIDCHKDDDPTHEKVNHYFS